VFPLDFRTLDIDLEEPRTISKLLREFCPGVSSRRCREMLLAVYGGIASREGEKEVVGEDTQHPPRKVRHGAGSGGL